MKGPVIGSWIAQIVAAGILGMTGVMKLMSNPDSIALMEAVGAEPWGRYALGIAELTTVVLLLVPRTAALGGVAVVGLMLGAVGTHVVKIGITYGGDASLFGMAVITLLAGVTVVALRRKELPGQGG